MSYGTIAKVLSLIAGVPSSIALMIVFARAFEWPVAITLTVFAFVLGMLSGVLQQLQHIQDAQKDNPLVSAYLALIKKELSKK